MFSRETAILRNSYTSNSVMAVDLVNFCSSQPSKVPLPLAALRSNEGLVGERDAPAICGALL